MNNFSAWFRGLRGRLLILVALPVLILGGVTWLSIHEINKLTDDLSFTLKTRVPVTRVTGKMDAEANAIGRWMWVAYVTRDPEQRKLGIEKTKAAIDAFDKAFTEHEGYYSSPKAKELFKPVVDNREKLLSAGREVIDLLAKNTDADTEKAKDIITGKYREASLPIAQGIQDVLAFRTEQANQEAEDKLNNASHLKALLTTGCLIATVALCLIGLMTASRLAKVLVQVTSQIGSVTTQVEAASSQLSAASQQVSAGSTESASALEETVASLEEMSSMVKLNAENAKQAAQLSQEGCRSAEEGESEIRNLITSMTEISASSKKIEEIINVIDDIAFQTNLLALNAAVEAARAGEQGKGFAVVAEAVRNLAQRSASAAKDIAVLIRESVSKTEHGSKVADTSGGVLKNIVSSIKKVSDLNNEIASASSEQANGIAQISKAMNELDTATQQNASASEEVASSSQEMSGQAVQLQKLVIDLTTLVQGKTSSSTNPAQGDIVSLRETTARAS